MATLANALRKDKVKHVSDENGWGEFGAGIVFTLTKGYKT